MNVKNDILLEAVPTLSHFRRTIGPTFEVGECARAPCCGLSRGTATLEL